MGFIYRNYNKDEINLTQDYIKIIDVEGLDTLENDINTISTINQVGSSFVSNNIESREIDLVLRVRVTEDNYKDIKRKFFKVFNPSLEGEFILTNPKSDKKLNVRVRNTPKFENTDYFYYKEVSITLVALDPAWKDTQETKTNIAIWQGSFTFPLFIPTEGIKMGYREPSLIANVNNLGDIQTGIRIEFKALGTLVNPKLINVDTQDFIKINKTMVKDEVITVTTDFANKKITCNKNGVIENAFHFLDLYSTFLQLELGDNLFRYDADEGLDNLEVSIYHTSRYLGV